MVAAGFVQEEVTIVGRPAKSVATKTGQITKAEEAGRAAVENMLKGGDDLTPPEYLTDSQREIYNFILSQLEESKMLGQLDVFILSRAAVAIDRIEYLDKCASKDPDMLFSNPFRQAQAQASTEFFRCCNELCRSPQSRAKLSISAVKSQEPKKKTLMELINGEDED